MAAAAGRHEGESGGGARKLRERSALGLRAQWTWGWGMNGDTALVEGCCSNFGKSSQHRGHRINSDPELLQLSWNTSALAAIRLHFEATTDRSR